MKKFVIIFILASSQFGSSTLGPRLEIEMNHPNVAKWADIILKYAGRHYRFVASVMDKESEGRSRPGSLIPVYDLSGRHVGYDRARCAMQVVPFYHSDKIAGRNIDDPDVCVEVGVSVLRNCGIDRDYKKSLECYNPRASDSYYRDILDY